MTSNQQAILMRHMPDSALTQAGETAMLPALMRWLVATGRLRDQTRVAHEVPWLGRRIDLALLTSQGMTTAFELKLGRLQRVLEQAAYNRASFHRSWVVTGNRPRAKGLRWAHELGVGLVVIQADKVAQLVMPAPPSANPVASRRLRAAIALHTSEGM
jgi:hypothetical protein